MSRRRQQSPSAARRGDRRARRAEERARQRRLRDARRKREQAWRRRSRTIRRSVLVVAAAGLVAAATWGPTRPRPVVLIPADAPLRSYTLEYRNDMNGVVDTTTVVVDRPYRGSNITRRDGEIRQGQVSTEGGLFSWTSGSEPGWLALDDRVHRSTGDTRPTSGLNEAIRRGRARVLGTDRVLGRPCTLVRTGEPMGQPVAKPDGGDRAEICVDRTGVVLRQEWWLGGRRVQQQVATRFRPGFVDESAFVTEPSTPVPAVEGVRLTSVTTPLSAEGRAGLRPLLVAPTGFEEAAAFAVLGPPSQLAGEAEFSLVQLVREDDGEVLEVEYRELPLPADAPAPPGDVVDLGRGRKGYLQVVAGVSNLTVVFGGQRVIARSHDIAALLQVGRTLRP